MRRLTGTPQIDTKEAAEADERESIERELDKIRNPAAAEKEVPTFKEWFNGRFWREWVIGRKNSEGEKAAKKSVYGFHLDKRFGKMRLDEIGISEVAQFRAELVEKKLSGKTINNILGVLSKPLHYAVDVQVIDRAPKVGIIKAERPEIT